MAHGGDESRRFPRLLARCRVRLHDRFGVWEAETEDVGPRGCRIVTPRLQTVGALVRLTVSSERVPQPLEVTGQIVWARAERPAKAGISFAGGAAPGAIAPAAWFAALSAAERGDPGSAPPPEVVIEVEPPVAEAESLVERLQRRAEELLSGGDPAAAEVIVRRALTLAPGDAALEAALRGLRAR